MTEQQIQLFKEILKKFIYKVRTDKVLQLVFHYHDNDFKREEGFKTYPVNSPEYLHSFNFDRTKRQIRKKILSLKNNYWKLNESEVKELESFCINHPNKFDEIFKSYIEDLWICSLESQIKEFQQKEKREKEEENNRLKEILGERYDLYKEVIPLILKDTSEYPYKSDKIKILLELELDVDTIYLILLMKEKWTSPKGYINKYFEERKEGIKQRKIVVYELNSTIKHIKNQLRKT